jgi:hypothetical protein
VRQCIVGATEDVMAKREQISVPVNPELRNAVERAAAREDRTVANWIRRVIAEAVRKAADGEQRAAGSVRRRHGQQRQPIQACAP